MSWPQVSIVSLMRKRIHLVVHSGLAILCIPHSGFAQLASQYDLRDIGNLAFVTAVQNQGSIGTCWTWAGMQAVESDLFKQGLLPVTPQLQQPVISAWQMATTNGNPELLEWNPQKRDYQATNGTYGWGGDMLDTIGYLTRGSGSWNGVGAIPGLTTTDMGGGPVMIQTNPKNAFNLQATNAHLNLAPFVPPANQPMAYLPTSIVDLSFQDRQRSAQANGITWDQADQVAAVKAAVTTPLSAMLGRLLISFLRWADLVAWSFKIKRAPITAQRRAAWDCPGSALLTVMKKW
jgi:hypothetical protein